MNEKKKVTIFPVLSTSICAIVWNILLFVDLYYGYTNKVSFILHIICAIAWDICAVAWVVRYIKSRKNNGEISI